MKHLFTIHSPLTFLVAYFTAKHLNLSTEDVIFISSRYNAPVCEFKVEKSYADQNGNILNKLKNLNLLKSYDRFIDSLTNGSEFICYIELMSMYQKILITHRNCRGFNFIEEGNSAYMAYDDINDLTWEGYYRDVTFREKLFYKKSFYSSLLRVIRGYNYRTLQIPYHYMAYVNFKNLHFYCLSDNAFYNAPDSKKILLPPPESNPLIKKLAKGMILENEFIWIDGSNSRYTGLSNDYYHDAIDKAVDIMKNQHSMKKIYLKLRPGLKNSKDVYIVNKLLKENIDISILPDDINLECLFISSKNCKVFGVLSAALEYAFVFGHESYSIYSLFDKQPPTYLDRMEGFWKNIKKLN